ncbi:MAG: hypothetical protein CYG60_24755 [Actinobacteria bacterium]|nr:MAG: hypothetical protein CYG60_24755 [Actinomycetota bacterium]
MLLAHRVYYLRLRGPIPNGKELDHLCRNRDCVNPDHLEPVEGRVNVQRGDAATLTPEVVRSIRSRHKAKSLTPAEKQRLAEEYGVTYSSIQNVCVGRTWKNI